MVINTLFKGSPVLQFKSLSIHHFCGVSYLVENDAPTCQPHCLSFVVWLVDFLQSFTSLSYYHLLFSLLSHHICVITHISFCSRSGLPWTICSTEAERFSRERGIRVSCLGQVISYFRESLQQVFCFIVFFFFLLFFFW